MIRFKRLRAQNAGCFRELSIPLDNLGNVLLVGENRDEPRTADGRRHSNGSGKTTVPELLTNGLFDVGSKPGFSKNGILNLYHPTDCFIEVEFQLAGHDYTIRRYRKHSNHGTSVRLFCDGADISCTGTRAIPDTQRLIESKLGITMGEWFGFVYLAQNHTHAMVTGKPSEKREYLSRVFSLDVIDDYDKKLKVYIDGLSEKTARLKLLEERRSELKTELRKLQTAEYPNDLADQVKQAQKNLREAEAQVAHGKASSRRASVTKRLVALGLDPAGPGFGVLLETERKKAKAALAEGAEARQQYMRRSDLKARVRTDLPDEDHVRHKIEEYSERLTALGEAAQLHAKLSKIDSVLAKLKQPEDTNSKALQKKIEKLKAKQEATSSRLAVVSSELKKLRTLDGHSECPTCLQPIKAEQVESLIQERETISKEEQKIADEIDSKLKEYGSDLDDLEAYVRVSADRDEVMASLEQLGAVEDATSVLRKVRAKQAAMQETLADIKTQSKMVKELAELPKPANVPTERELESLRVRLDTLTEARAHEWDTPAVDVDTARSKRKKAQKKLDALLAERAACEQHKERLSQVDTELREVKRRIAKLDEVSTGHHVASTMRLALKDLKSLRLHEATRVLTSILPGYVSAMFPGKNVTVKIDDRKADAFDLIFEKGGKIVPLTSLSGGQGKKVAIATILAFTQLTSKRVNLLIADEPYSALDRPSRQICDELIREAGVPSTLLMTHDLDLLARRYDRVWRCIMKNNVTTLRRNSSP